MTLIQTVTSAILPSGELAEFTWWGDCLDLSDGVAGYQAWADTLAADSTWKGLFTSTTAFREGRVNEVDMATGVVLSAVTAGTAYAGTAVGGAIPPQCAEVITLRTARAGRSYTGRMYLPSFAGTSLATNGRISAPDYANAAESMAAALLEYVGAGPSNDVVVYSRTLHDINVVTAIDCGDVFDTQRRRRDKLVEVRHSVGL